MSRIFLIIGAITLSFNGFAQKNKSTPSEYVEKWKDVAIFQMVEYRIPASITLAQGILESGSGNSMLATRANNHFGIKCHDWTGKKFYQDDDAINECFRKYKNAAESYKDHSEFLSNRSRYAFLFDLEITDYKSWAKGLKKAGYATNPKYANLLIDIIQKYDLNQYDQFGVEQIVMIESKTSKDEKNPTINLPTQSEEVIAKEIHKVYTDKNRTKYVIATGNDTFYQIAKEFSLNLKQLHKYNNFPPHQDILKEGDIVYIMNKNRKANTDIEKIRIEAEENLWSLSQKYGIKLDVLLKKNNLSNADIALSKGDIIYLK
ncbi:MAG: glucosaminidase domain-containing protein [Brumimicrobium sp.]